MYQTGPCNPQPTPISTFRANSLKPRLALKSHANKITPSPDDRAPADIVKIVECDFKVQWQDVEILQLNSRAAIRYVANVASKDAALLVKE